jgi:hypothetical protein
MNLELQTVVVVAAVAASLSYVVWRGVRFFRGGGNNGCGSCSSSSCDSSVQLIEIGQSESIAHNDRDSIATELERTS